MIKAILMDFNGGIINDEPLHLKAYQEVLKGEGIDLTEEEYYSCLGMDDKTFIEAAYRRAEKEPETNKIFEIMTAKTHRWRDFVSGGVPLFDGAEDFVRKMAKEFALGIVSMARREEIEYILEQIGLRDCFLTVVSAEDVSVCKPNPECYVSGFRQIDAARIRIGRNPIVHNECLVVEDSPQGVMAGKRADLKTLGVTNTVGEAELREAGADVVTASLADWIPEAVKLVF